MLGLVTGTRYYVTVRAVTGAGNLLESSSNGVMLDLTAPVAYFTQVTISSVSLLFTCIMSHVAPLHLPCHLPFYICSDKTACYIKYILVL